MAFRQLESALNSFSAGALPQIPLRELTVLPQTHSWFKRDPASKGKGGEKREWDEGRAGKRRGEEGRGEAGPLTQIPASAPEYCKTL